MNNIELFLSDTNPIVEFEVQQQSDIWISWSLNGIFQRKLVTLGKGNWKALKPTKYGQELEVSCEGGGIAKISDYGNLY